MQETYGRGKGRDRATAKGKAIAKGRGKEVFTLPQVFLVDPRRMTRNSCRSTQIPSREWNSLLLMFWPLQSTWIHADPHGFQVKLHRILGLYSDNSKLTFMCVD
jgi:hypothetical protein